MLCTFSRISSNAGEHRTIILLPLHKCSSVALKYFTNLKRQHTAFSFILFLQMQAIKENHKRFIRSSQSALQPEMFFSCFELWIFPVSDYIRHTCKILLICLE